jgi:hypothetical protein
MASTVGFLPGLHASISPTVSASRRLCVEIFRLITVGAIRVTHRAVYRRLSRLAIFAAGALLPAVAPEGRAGAVCVGDCDGNGALAMNELIWRRRWADAPE